MAPPSGLWSGLPTGSLHQQQQQHHHHHQQQQVEQQQPPSHHRQHQSFRQHLLEKPLPPPPPPTPPPQPSSQHSSPQRLSSQRSSPRRPSPPRSPSQARRPVLTLNGRAQQQQPQQQQRHYLQPPGSAPLTSSHRRTGSNASGYEDQSMSQGKIRDLEFVDGSLLQVESSSDSDDLQPTPRRRPQHGRSMSHPFPSLFSTKKKKASPAAEAGGSGASDQRHVDDQLDAPVSGARAPGRRTYQKHGQSSGSKDLTTGNCMSCGCLMRWPVSLTVFKCTVCMTINDLKPTDHEFKQAGDSKHGRSGDNSNGSTYTQPISLEHTKLLIRQCLRGFISSSLPQRANSSSSPLNQRVLSPPTNLGGASLSPPDAETWESECSRRLLFSRVDASGLTESPVEDSTLLETPEIRPAHRSYSSSYTGRRPMVQGFSRQTDGSNLLGTPPGGRDSDPRKIFKPLEDYLVTCFTSWRSLNSSFGGPRPSNPQAAHADEARKRPSDQRSQGGGGGGSGGASHVQAPIAELDAKLLLLGDIAENGMWWTGGQQAGVPSRTKTTSNRADDAPAAAPTRHLGMEWAELDEWYSTVINAGQPWKAVYDGMVAGGALQPADDASLRGLEAQILVGQDHSQRVLLKATETLLKRPGRPLVDPSDIRFLLILVSNPLLSARCRVFSGQHSQGRRDRNLPSADTGDARGNGPVSGQHSGIIKRILGLISNSSNECHNQLINWLVRYPGSRFMEVKDLVSGFLAYRLLRQTENKQNVQIDVTGGLIPDMSADRSVATLHAALGQSSGQSKKGKERPKKVVFSDDWQIKAASRVMALIFTANNLRSARRSPSELSLGQQGADSDRLKGRVFSRGQLLPTSDFYVALLDDSDLMADYENWESRRAKFSFCQYPFLLSIWAKIQILEHDAKRQMEKMARDAFFDSIMRRRNFEQYLHLNVRRDCLVEDSLRAVSEVIGSGGEDIKKGIRIAFRGEEGVDAGGLRKEWFLLLVREVFNPDHGLFIYDEDSQYCYFNPYSFETSDQYFLVGVVLGLAIYNSTILDIALPPFAFRKLLAAAPTPSTASPTHFRPAMNYTLEDLGEFRPRLARGLKQLLDYEGDVESTFCLDFAVDVDKYGLVERVPLTPGGENKPVTNSNRREYVDLYVRYLLETAVSRQFDPFKRGFFTVCGGNALSLFRPEEIELLVRGSEETLDVDSLRTVAQYDGWGSRDAEQSEPTVRWFWQLLEEASPSDQRKMLTFITGSDRIPAMGAASLTIRLVCLGDDCERYPTARTCFNTLTLWRYGSKEKLGRMLWAAVNESEGFGLK